jgi:hypothetical protein
MDNVIKITIRQLNVMLTFILRAATSQSNSSSFAISELGEVHYK